MIWHHDKLMQQILSSRPIVKEDVDKEVGHSVGLKNVAPLKGRGSDEVATVSGIAAAGSCHEAPQRLKPLLILPLYRSAKGAAPPKSKEMFAASQFGTGAEPLLILPLYRSAKGAAPPKSKEMFTASPF